MKIWIVLLNAALCVASGNVTRDICKEQICSCSEIEGELHIDCEKKRLTTLQHLTGPSSQFYHLLLHGNSLSKLFPNEFANFYNAVSLHLENNGLHDIVPGAFLGLQLVKRLHINNNKIRSFRKSTFLGLDDLEYLQADFNLLRDIDPAVFRDLNKLEVLILNDNLISALPINVFQHVPITHLDLRGNRIKTLPYEGILEQIPGIAEVLLEDNPWDCNCDLLSLKEWLENIPHNALIGRVICEAPTRLQGGDLNETSEADLCPSKNGGADTSLVAPPTQDEASEAAAGDAGPHPTPKPNGDAPGGPATPGHGPRSRSKSRENWQLKMKPTPVTGAVDGEREQLRNTTCPQPCSCTLIGSRQGLGVNCEGKKIESLAHLRPKPLAAQELNMRDNNIHAIKKNHLVGYSSLNLLHLGGNNIKVIDNSTFHNLTELIWLYMDKNYLDTLVAEMFVGLQNLEYLSLEYNDIQLIVAGAFSPMPKLKVLLLNNNLLKTLPVDAFLGTSLSKISLHNNYFTHLAVSGVLDQLSSILQIDLHGNPWDCSCNIVPFKLWTEKLAPDAILSELKCESPEEFWNKDFRRVQNDLMCPKLYERIPPTSLSKNNTFTVDSAAGSRSNSYLEPSRVSISVLVPGLLLVFVTSAFTVVGMLVFILRNRKKSKRRDGNSSASEINSLQTVCDSSYWHSGGTGPYHHAAGGGAHSSFDCSVHFHSTTNDV